MQITVTLTSPETKDLDAVIADHLESEGFKRTLEVITVQRTSGGNYMITVKDKPTQ